MNIDEWTRWMHLRPFEVTTALAIDKTVLTKGTFYIAAASYIADKVSINIVIGFKPSLQCVGHLSYDDYEKYSKRGKLVAFTDEQIAEEVVFRSGIAAAIEVGKTLSRPILGGRQGLDRTQNCATIT